MTANVMAAQYKPTASHFIGMMNMHYAAADFFAKNKKLSDAAVALELAEAARIKARELGAKV